MLLKSKGRSEYFLFQDDECVTAMNIIPPGDSEIMGRVHIADRSDKARGLMPGKVTQLINFKATIVALTLRYLSIDHLQAY